MDKKFYNTVCSTCFSPCGGYFIAGNIFGDIIVYDIKGLSSYTNCSSFDLDESVRIKPKFQFKSNNNLAVNSMVYTDNFFIIGTNGEITGWEWNGVISGNPKTSWIVHIPKLNDGLKTQEVNCLAVGYIGEGNSSMVLFAGCGDTNVYAFSLEDGKCLKTYVGHTNYIHDISTIDFRLASASEDGSIRLWDTRTPDTTNIIEPHKNLSLNRPELGNWVGAVCLNDDWLVCGGGPRASLWHQRMLKPMTIFTSMDGGGIHVARFIEDRIFTGGDAPYFAQFTYDNELCSKIQISSSKIICCSYRRGPIKLLMLAGNSNKIDVCTSLSYRDFTFPFF